MGRAAYSDERATHVQMERDELEVDNALVSADAFFDRGLLVPAETGPGQTVPLGRTQEAKRTQ